MNRLILWIRAWIARAVILLPDRLSARLLPAHVRYDASQIPGPIVAPTTPIRLLVAPANYAAQGYAWARAVEQLDGVGAINMQIRAEGDYGFPADYAIGLSPFRRAHHWSRRHRRAVISGFTHVLFEAERPFLGRVSNFEVPREVEMLRDAGLQVAFVSHGTDLRLPSRHAVVDKWSPFEDASAPWVQSLETKAAFNNALLDRMDAPVFVVTPELLLDRPDARWLPNVVDPTRWASDAVPLAEGRPRLLHAPTNRVLKGTDLIEPIVQALHDHGVVEYLPRAGVPSQEMPELYRSVDVVLEQFRLGIYSTTALEAMAAGRVVVGYLRDQVREHVRAVSGLEVPVVQATADDLESVLRDIASRRAHYQEIAAQGPAFVRALHDGTYSAQVLAEFLTQSPTA